MLARTSPLKLRALGGSRLMPSGQCAHARTHTQPITTCAAAGCMAALEAEHYLAEHGAEVPDQAEAHWKPTATVTTQPPVNANGHAPKPSPVLA